jgi:hypothetical protein
MLYTTALTEVRARLQELVADFWTDAELYRALNEGITRFAMEEKWPYLYTISTGTVVTAGTATMPIVAGVAYEREFNLILTLTGDSRPRMPARVSPNEGYRLRRTYYTNSQEPIAYYIASEAGVLTTGVYTATVRFVPPMTRNATVEYQYIRDPVLVLSGATTEHLDVPPEFVMGPIAYATGHLFLKELQFSQKADEQFGLYRKVVQDAMRESRKLTPDSGFAWGSNQPQFGYIDDDVFTELVTPPMLGP